MINVSPTVPDSHVVDVLGSTRGRDQPIMLVERALQLVKCLDPETFSDERTVFLDPFCKAGEILLAMAMQVWAIKRNASSSSLHASEIAKELYNGRYYGLAPDERHYLLSVRTFYGNERSHQVLPNKQITNGNYLSVTDGRLDESRFKETFTKMIEYIRKTIPSGKIVVVGNPPYQEADGGAQSSAKPIYNFFVEALIDSKAINEFALVIPARWFSGGKGLDSFRRRMMESKNIKDIHYFEKAEEVFPTVQVKGGICFLHWKDSYQGESTFIYRGKKTKIDLSKFDIILDDPESYSIIDKVINSNTAGFVSKWAWSRKPFGLGTSYFKQHEEDHGDGDLLRCYTANRKIKCILKSRIQKNVDHINSWKVVAPKAYGKGMKRCTLPKSQMFIIGPGEISTETYNVISTFNTRSKAERFQKYLQTDFARYLLGLRKLTQDIPKDRWDWVPIMDLATDWTDDGLFDYFKLNRSEREHIKTKVQEWA